LSTNKNELDENITYSLLQSHGRFREFVQFAESRGKFEDVILHHINEEKYSKALDKMKKLKTATLKKKLAYKHSVPLMREQTRDFIDFLENDIRDFELPKLIAAFMAVPPNRKMLVVDFLWHYCTETTLCKEKSIHNIYVFLLSEIGDEARLDEYINKQEHLAAEMDENGGVLFDMDFALRNFQKHDLVRP